MDDQADAELENQIGLWRTFLQNRDAIHSSDVEELEDHLRGQIEELSQSGLSPDEAFLVAVKRMGDMQGLSREFSLEYSERLWKQLALPGTSNAEESLARTENYVVFSLAICAALAFKAPELFGIHLFAGGEYFYAHNSSLFVLPFLCGYFVWKRQLPVSFYRWLVIPFVSAILLINLYPFSPGGATEVLAIIHLPIALWLVIGYAYAGPRWSNDNGRMDFVRYSGELLIYYVLIALGGGALTALTMGIFAAIGIDAEDFLTGWVIPCGALGAVIIGSWLVEAKQGVVENMAPILTRLFTPLFTLMLFAFLVTMLWTGQGIDVEREVLIGFDLLLAMVLGLLLYSISARDLQKPADLFDYIQTLLIVLALLVDLIALIAILARISEFGFSANKVAALGENIILLISLGGSAYYYGQFLRGKAAFTALLHWQMAYLPVYSKWAALVVIIFPPLFNYL